jgi:hypothetical protein
MGNTALAIILLVIFDFAVIFLLKISLKDVKIINALKEKTVVPPPTGSNSDDNTSFSRLAGLLGAIVLAVFFWMLGNVVIWQLLASPTEVATTVDSTYKYFLVGAALFAPYAVNQIASIFKQ